MKTFSFVNEPTLPSLADVPIEFFSKVVHFTNASKDLMSKCLQGGFVLTFNKFCESDASFRQFSHIHGRPIDSNKNHHIIERRKKFQKSVKVINIGDILGLSPLEILNIDKFILLKIGT